ncbi:MAG: DUF937 domain-containing protein [Pseudomonadota bacterium]
MNLDSLLSLATAAGGDRLVPDLASRLNVSETDASAGLSALLPTLGAGLRQAQNENRLDDVLSMATGRADPEENVSGEAPNLGMSIVSSLFGGQANAEQVASASAQRAGVDASLVQRMLPVLATLLINQMPNRGADADSNALASLLGGGRSSGGLGGMLGGVLSSGLGGALGGGSRNSGGQAGAGLLAGLLDTDGDGDVADDVLNLIQRR